MSRSRRGWIALAVIIGLLLVVPMARGLRSLIKTRGALATFTRLIGSANAQDLATVRALCTNRYRESHPIQPATEGGVIGLPRNIHKNFQVWTEGDEVWLCPGNREGVVYRLVKQQDQWKFDGLVGLLKRGRVEVPELDPQE